MLIALLETRTEETALEWLQDHQHARGDERERREDVVLADGELIGA